MLRGNSLWLLAFFTFFAGTPLLSGAEEAKPANSLAGLIDAFRISPLLTQLDSLKYPGVRDANSTLQNDHFRASAAYVLGQSRIVEAIPTLTAILQEEGKDSLHEQVRLQAVRALGKIGTPEALAPLKDASNKDASEIVRTAAIEAMKANHDQPLLETWFENLTFDVASSEWKPPIKPNLTDLQENLFIRAIAAQKITEVGAADPRTLEVFRNALKGTKFTAGPEKWIPNDKFAPVVAFKIYQAIWQLGSKDSLAFLTELEADAKTPDRNKRFLNFFLKSPKDTLTGGNSISVDTLQANRDAEAAKTTAAMVPTAPPAGLVVGGRPPQAGPATGPQPAATRPPPGAPPVVSKPGTARITDSPIARLPLISSEGKEQGCVYQFSGKCFARPVDLLKYLDIQGEDSARVTDFLLKQIKTARPGVGQPVPTDIISYSVKGETCAKGFLFEGKCFPSHTDLNGYLIQLLPEGTAAIMAPPPPAENTMPRPVATEPENKPTPTTAPPQPKPMPAPTATPPAVTPPAPAPKATPAKAKGDDKKSIGELEDKQGGYLQLGYYSKLGPKGPTDLKSHKVPLSKEDDVTKWTAICINEKDLLGLLPQDPDPRKLGEAELETILPIMPDAAIGSGSLDKRDEKICYALVREPRVLMEQPGLARRDFSKAKEASRLVFDGFDGIKALSPEMQKELEEVWDSSAMLPEKIAALESYWQKKIEDLDDDAKEYQGYFDGHKDHNLIQAASELKKGGHLAKHFALGVSLYQLSKGEVPVRFSQAFSLSESDKLPILITTDKLLLQVEYLLPPDAEGKTYWQTADTEPRVLP